MNKKSKISGPLVEEVEIIQSWECNECGLPCRIQIHTSDTLLPDFLKGNDRFRYKDCPVDKTLRPKWIRLQ